MAPNRYAAALVGILTLALLTAPIVASAGSNTPTPTQTPTETQTPTPVGTDDDIYVENPDADPDRDGLNNSCEVLHTGTDPNDADTDGDGLEDGWEVQNDDADPLSRDIFVEIDRVENETAFFDAYEKESLRELFADAPIENPDGTEGVTLHFNDSDVIPESESPAQGNSMTATKGKYKDSGQSHYYVVFTGEKSEVGGEMHRGYAKYDYAVMQIQPWYMQLYGGMPNTGLFMHELGHVLGLRDSVFDGIDSYNYSYAEYQSAMNYNAEDLSDYSSSDPHDDWQHLEDRGFGRMYTSVDGVDCR